MKLSDKLVLLGLAIAAYFIYQANANGAGNTSTSSSSSSAGAGSSGGLGKSSDGTSPILQQWTPSSAGNSGPANETSISSGPIFGVVSMGNTATEAPSGPGNSYVSAAPIMTARNANIL